MFNKKGFTLVELMIVVAIIGILAAIAIPNFVEMQLRAKRAELPSNIDAIKTTEMAYDAAFDQFIFQDAPVPTSAVGKAPQDWVYTTNFAKLGWQPDGKVRGAYSVTTNGLNDFKVEGISDVDGDGNQASYTATSKLNTTMVTENDVY